MKILLSKPEVELLKKEFGVKTIESLEDVIVKKIPNKYNIPIQFTESVAGSLGIIIDDKYCMVLFTILNPNSNPTTKQLLLDWNKSKTKIILSNTNLIMSLFNIRKQVMKIASLIK